MAESASHKLGQVIGHYFEASIQKFLSPLFTDNVYYLDFLHPRQARNGKKKVTWEDQAGRKHDLDYVVEKGGSEATVGRLAAVIEVAWRTGGRHSANKCQEISGAVNPIIEANHTSRPYKAAILAGEFTPGPLETLSTQNFDVVYFSKKEIQGAFEKSGIDIFISDNDEDDKAQRQIDRYESLSESEKAALSEDLYELMQPKMGAFVARLMSHLKSEIKNVIIGTTFSKNTEFSEIETAIDYLNANPENISGIAFSGYVIYINFENGGEIKITAGNKSEAITHLRRFT